MALVIFAWFSCSDDDDSVDELIINSALADLIPEDGPKAQAFRDVMSFIKKVMHL
jgi:hypothetical protein